MRVDATGVLAGIEQITGKYLFVINLPGDMARIVSSAVPGYSAVVAPVSAALPVPAFFGIRCDGSPVPKIQLFYLEFFFRRQLRLGFRPEASFG